MMTDECHAARSRALLGQLNTSHLSVLECFVMVFRILRPTGT